MSTTSRWLVLLIVIVAALGIVGLIAYARGPEHYRGDELGSHGTRIIVVQPSS
jgi:hypothetical protein